MAIDEVEVYVTPDGLGRAAIVRRSDGFLCIYLHWIARLMRQIMPRSGSGALLFTLSVLRGL